MQAAELLDRVYGELRDLADSGTVTREERVRLNETAEEARFHLRRLELAGEERDRRAVTFGPAGAVLTG